MRKSQKLSGGENGSEKSEETSRLYCDKDSRLMFISGSISWQLAADFFSVLIGFESLHLRKPLTIYIDSGGGNIYAMFKIYDHIKNSPLSIVTIVAGCAFSAGFIVFMAGDRREMFPNSFLGFHAPTIYFTGEDSEGPDQAAESSIHQSSILNIMVRIVKDNSNMPGKTIREYFRSLTRIDAKTALKFGLAHQIINPPKKVLPKSWPASPELLASSPSRSGQRGERKIMKEPK